MRPSPKMYEQFQRLTGLDPRLLTLLEDAQAVLPQAGIDRSRIFRSLGFLGRVQKLSGWYREEGPSQLQTSDAYDCVYEMIYLSLPDRSV